MEIDVGVVFVDDFFAVYYYIFINKCTILFFFNPYSPS